MKVIVSITIKITTDCVCVNVHSDDGVTQKKLKDVTPHTAVKMAGERPNLTAVKATISKNNIAMVVKSSTFCWCKNKAAIMVSPVISPARP